jgi:hypothetical protein
MLATSTVNSSFTELSPSPIKATNNSEQLAGTSLLMHSSFGVRRHSDDVNSASTFRPRRSISSSAGQSQTPHVVCMHNNYSHSLSSQQQTISDDEEQTKNPNQDSFNDDDDDIIDELNLAVVVGNEDGQSLKGFTTEQTNGSLDVAFIDEADLERNLSNTGNEQLKSDVQIFNSESNLSQTIVAEQRNSIERKAPILVEKTLNKDDDLDEILRRNENRSIRLTDSDVSYDKFNITE